MESVILNNGVEMPALAMAQGMDSIETARFVRRQNGLVE